MIQTISLDNLENTLDNDDIGCLYYMYVEIYTIGLILESILAMKI